MCPGCINVCVSGVQVLLEQKLQGLLATVMALEDEPRSLPEQEELLPVELSHHP